MLRRDIYAQAARTERELIEDLRDLYDDIEVDFDELLEAVRYNDFGRVEQISAPTAAIIAAIAALLARVLSAHFANVGAATAAPWRGQFNPLDRRYVAWLNEYANDLAVRTAASAAQSARGIILRGITEGASPEEITRRLMNALWLLPQHALAIDTMRAAMRRAGLEGARLDSAIRRALERYLRYRIILIAATAVSAATSQAQQFAWAEAVRLGLLDDDAKVQWVTIPDEKRCPACRPLHLVTRYIGVPFPGGLYGPPAHPICRCHLELLIQ